MNGQTINIGDTDYRFGIESVSKVHTAILILRQYGAQKVLDMIGADATGLPFNSIIAILLENDHPSTPLVNAGAISACSMVEPVGNSDKKWEAIVQNITDLCGSAPQLIDELYKSETATNFNNRSIAWLLKNYNRIYDNPDMALDLYTRQCSLGITAGQLAIAAGTIANTMASTSSRLMNLPNVRFISAPLSICGLMQPQILCNQFTIKIKKCNRFLRKCLFYQAFQPISAHVAR